MASIDFVDLFVGLLLSAAMVAASHLATQVVAADLPGSKLGLWVRYVLGCLAILAGLLVMLSWQDWAVVAGFMAWCGLVTAGVAGLVRWWKLEQRAATAEEAHDRRRARGQDDGQ